MSQAKSIDFYLSQITWPTVNHKYYWRVCQYWTWTILSKTIISIVIFGIMNEGLKLLVPPLGKKLFKIPLLGFLEDFEETHDLDVSVLFAIGLIVGVWVLWTEVIEIFLILDTIHSFSPRQLFVLILGMVIIGADAIIFAFGISEFSWGEGGFTFSSFIATAAYLALLIFSCWVSVNLKKSVKEAL